MARFTGYSLPTGTHYRLYMMLQTTIPIHCSSNSPRFEAGNSCLRGHFINRDLSRLLVLILLILTPLTYSNDSIPNFQPDGVSSFSLKTKTGTTVAVTRPDLPITVTVTAVTVVSLHSTHSNPHISPVRSSQPSRAPPA